ncbi:MAG: ATP-binding protein [Spirochaetales bacterium]|nr:ATP-binding protein [Spirochaetales bacterium]
MVERTLENAIRKRLSDHKVIVLYGARQTGKTTLLKQMFKGKEKVLWLNGDESEVRSLLNDQNSQRLAAVIADYTTVVIDEAQRIEHIGLTLKLIHDTMDQVKLICTGSSSFMLARSTSEPLTGRKWEFVLHPFSFEELANHRSVLEELQAKSLRLTYGSYPDIALHPDDSKSLLTELVTSYLYRDVLEFELLRKSSKIEDLLKALALQVGGEVSLNELARLIGLDVKTIDRYLLLLEQSFVIFRLPSFARNMRNEIKRGRKIYFVDNGVLNTILSKFAVLENRSDVGSLWENYLIGERRKYLSNHGLQANMYFWRTHSQQEIDYIEESDGELFAYEFKWNSRKRPTSPRSFLEAYPSAHFAVVNQDNYEQFLMGKM